MNQYIYEVYLQIFKRVSFWLHGCCGEWKVGPLNQVNHTNRMDVICCHLIHSSQSVPQQSYNRTLQFSKTFRLNRNDIFSLSSYAVLPLENPLNVFKCYMFTTLMSLVLDYTAVAVSGKVGPVKPINHTSLVAAITQTDRPKSVRIRCVIKLFLALFVLSLCPFDISVGEGAFLIRLSQISSFFS